MDLLFVFIHRFFYSCITPSASGGQPAQIYYMRQKDIPVPVSTLVLMVITITYKAVLVLMGLGLMAFGQGFLHTYLQQILPVFYLGIGLNVICVAILVVLVFHNSLARSIMRGGLALLERLHLLRCKESRHEKLEAGMENTGRRRHILKPISLLCSMYWASPLHSGFRCSCPPILYTGPLGCRAFRP